MDFVNKNIIIAVLLGLVFCFLGEFLAKVKSKPMNFVLLSINVIFSIPAILFIIYYFHFFEMPIWYFEYRAIPAIELLSSLVGLPVGYLMRRFFIGVKLSVPATLLFVSVPFLKPIISPINNELQNRWIDAVCLQSCGSTCGPASLATIFNYYRISKTEEEIAKECFSCASSTEIWYLIRYA